MKTKVFHSYGTEWGLSGVNTWTINMAQGMVGSEFSNEVLFTGIPESPQPTLDRAGVPYHFLSVREKRSRTSEWRELKRFLEMNAPCIYIPNYDFHRASAIGTFSPEVRVCSVSHSDEKIYYREISRLGTNLDQIVAVSSRIKNKLLAEFPHLSERITYIPHGIPSAGSKNEPRPSTGQLRLCYCNRLSQYQKRVLDLPPVLAELRALDLDFHLDIAGDGPDREKLKASFETLGLLDRVTFLGRISNEEVQTLLLRSHCFLLTSDFEGLPISLMEAMFSGCVPIVYQIDSGISDLLNDDLEVCQVDHGKPKAIADRLVNFWITENKLEQLSNRVRGVAEANFSLQQMAESYGEVFTECLHSSVKRTGRIRALPEQTITYRVMQRLRMIRA